jgi:hypothetical protein
VKRLNAPYSEIVQPSVLVSRPFAVDIQKLLAPEMTTTTIAIDLVVTLNAEDINLRDLGRFFLLLDRVYGRLLYGDLKKYAWNEKSQLRISQMRAGSLEIDFTQILQVVPNPTAILILYIFLKLLPKTFHTGADAVLKLSTAYNNYEQARLARANRKKLRDQMDKDEELRNLSTQRKKQIAEIVDLLIREEPAISNAALDFAESSFRSVTIRLKTSQKDQT